MADYGIFGDTMRKVAKHRERIGAKSIKAEAAEAAKDNAPAASEGYHTKRQKGINDSIRARRASRKKG